MVKRFGFRFSLLSLLLVMTVAALVVSHWRTNAELEVAQQKLRGQRQTIRSLNDRLGLLTIDDESQIHVISLTPDLDRHQSPLKTTYKWHVYFPEECDWKMCWAAGVVPQTGVPKAKLGSRVLEGERSPDGTSVLSCSQGPRLDPGMSLVFRCGEELWFANMPPESLKPFDDNGWIETEHCGSVSEQAKTQSYSINDKVVLLRQWGGNYGTVANRQGLVVWLEAVAKE